MMGWYFPTSVNVQWLRRVVPGMAIDCANVGGFVIGIWLTNLKSALVGSGNQMVDDRSPGLKDACELTLPELGSNVASECRHKVSPTYCSLAIIICFVAKISCGLLAALIPVVIAAKFEKNPSASLCVNSSMSVVFWGGAVVGELNVPSRDWYPTAQLSPFFHTFIREYGSSADDQIDFIVIQHNNANIFDRSD